MSAQQDSRDFVRLLTGKEPSVVLELRSQEVEATQALEAQQQEQTRSQRLEFLRRLTGKTTPNHDNNRSK